MIVDSEHATLMTRDRYPPCLPPRPRRATTCCPVAMGSVPAEEILTNVRNEARCPISGATENLWACPLIPYAVVDDEQQVFTCDLAEKGILSQISRLSVWSGCLVFHGVAFGTTSGRKRILSIVCAVRPLLFSIINMSCSQERYP